MKMPKIKHHFRLNVMGVFYVGQWNHYPTDEDVIIAMDNRFNGKQTLNGELMTFQVEKVHYIESE